MAKRIELWPLDKLVPYDRNPRTHSGEQIAQIAASIVEFGFLNPILVDSSSGIIAGHGRLQAAKQIGLVQVPVVVLDHLTEAQKRAYVIADNKLALNAGWDEDILRSEIELLSGEDFELSLLGFSDEELGDLLAETVESEGQTDDDNVPDTPAVAITKPGDIWSLGQHTLLCGDSTNMQQVERILAGERGDMVFTDPPWNVNYGAVAKNNAQGYKPRKILNDHQEQPEWARFCTDLAVSLFAAVKAGAPIYVVMSAQEWPVIDDALRGAGFHWSSTIIWAKDRLVLSRKDYHTQYEPIWYGWHGESARAVAVEDRTQSDLWQCNRPSKSDLHPTMKPVELVERAITNSSKPKAVVLDLFGGSGSTLIACEKTGRRCRMIELDPLYCDVIVKRWEEFTGRKAELVAA